MAKFKPQSAAVITRNKRRKADQHTARMLRQEKLLKVACGAARRLARKDISAWKQRRKQRLQTNVGTIQGKAPTLTRIMATIEREVEE